MEDYGIASGVKGLSKGLNSAREAGKELTKTIESIQHDAVDVAQQELNSHKRHKTQEEILNNSLIYKAIQEYKTQHSIIQEENKAEAEFKTKYGSKEWDKVLQIKVVVEKEMKENRTHYGHKLKDVQRVQLYCWFAAFVVTCLLYYFKLV